MKFMKGNTFMSNMSTNNVSFNVFLSPKWPYSLSHRLTKPVSSRCCLPQQIGSYREVITHG